MELNIRTYRPPVVPLGKRDGDSRGANHVYRQIYLILLHPSEKRYILTGLFSDLNGKSRAWIGEAW